MQVELHPEASLELHAAHAWLENEGQGLGDALADSVAETIQRIRRFPYLGPAVGISGVSAEIRQVLIPRFQYLVVYRVGPDLLQVVAIAHTRRRPGYWRDRLH